MPAKVSTPCWKSAALTSAASEISSLSMEPTTQGVPDDPLAAVRARASENLYWRYLGVQVDDAKPGWVRLTTIWGPFAPRRTSVM